MPGNRSVYEITSSQSVSEDLIGRIPVPLLSVVSLIVISELLLDADGVA